MATLSETKRANLESAVLFMQQEHATTLKGLHEEIQTLQKRCSDLTFQLAMQSTSSSQEDEYKQRVEVLEKEIAEKKKQEEELYKTIDKREAKIISLEQALKAFERKQFVEIQTFKSKVTTLESALNAKSDEVVLLREQLRQQRGVAGQNSEDPVRSSFSPAPPREGTPTSFHRSQYRNRKALVDANGQPVIARKLSSSSGSSLGMRPVSGRRLPQTPQHPQPMPDPTPFLHAQDSDPHLLLTRQATTVLPPIRGGKEPRHHTQAVLIHRQKNKTVIAKDQGSPTRVTPEVETLAVDRISLNDNQQWRQTEQSNGREY
ncbi:coiled-coil domain-containing protein 92 [Lingula anatina]|uniref:Coiled-coil domain-containing protein 92 n=1 Tax=Lingula anatina TaxID=7574 RepID=A0A1S3J6V4_LINAN|nr:coiled-coil domain-containing protein 92 [Lingula anatina]|eukprot:XP_013406043.1 coiled-coil domain-containing protein 92 [Lingula anatina]